jgi:phage gpG-like protein
VKTVTTNAAGKVSFDIGDLRALARSIKASKSMRVRVGLFPNKAARKESEITNPVIGAIHEFGSKVHNIPARSWLRMPIMLYFRPTVEGKGRAWWRSSLSTKGMASTLKKLGICAENTIQNAFETGGFGQWRPLSKATIEAKGSSAILIDTGELRKAVASKVVHV